MAPITYLLGSSEMARRTEGATTYACSPTSIIGLPGYSHTNLTNTLHYKRKMTSIFCLNSLCRFSIDHFEIVWISGTSIDTPSPFRCAPAYLTESLLLLTTTKSPPTINPPNTKPPTTDPATAPALTLESEEVEMVTFPDVLLPLLPLGVGTPFTGAASQTPKEVATDDGGSAFFSQQPFTLW